MRAALAVIATLFFATPALAADRIECSQIPHAQSFVDGLRPGPNTRLAQRHLDAAKRATSDQECVAELGKVNYYARRSAAADRRIATGRSHIQRVPCADALHQNRPGGMDYHGAPVASCRQL